MEYVRKTQRLLAAHLEESPVVWIRGARQVGKSTLAQSVADDAQRSYISFDDETALTAAQNDPQGFILGLSGKVTLDEVQRVPGLFQAIKLSVDRDRMPGRFLLTGSANVLALPKASESLAGRMQILNLEPLAQVEIENGPGHFIDHLLSGDLSKQATTGAPLTREELWRRVVIGGYPNAVKARSTASRERLFDGYLRTLLDRDLRDITEITRLTQVPQLLEVLASRSSSLLNRADLGRALSIPKTTLERYISLLEILFIHTPLEAYHADAALALAKAPKVQLLDTGLAASLLGLDEADSQHRLYGHLLESFVCNEVRRLATWQPRPLRIRHFRTKHGAEVDLVLDSRKVGVIGIEVKATHSLKPKDFNGLAALKQAAKGRWARGIILYAGDQVVPFGEFTAVPLRALWQW